MEIVIRVAVIYLVVLVSLRILGKREFSQLSPFELVTLLLIPEIVSQALTHDDQSVTNAFVGLMTLFSLVFLTSVITHMNKKAEDIIEGTPSVLVHNGGFIVKNMESQRVTPDEVFAEMHKSGIEDLPQVRWAILESDGKITVIPEDAVDRAKQGRQPESEPVG